MEKKPVRLVIFGRQGAGKGTQCANLIDRYGLVHVSTGDMLRAERAAGTELGLKAAEVMAAGGLVGDDIIIPMAANRIAAEDAVTSGFVLDGFPRTLEQAKGLVALVGTDALDLVVDLNVPLDEVTTRMKARKREDDTDEAISQRLGLYEDQTRPVLEWFADLGLVAEVDGLGTEDEVRDRLFAAIDEIAGNEGD